MSKEPDYSSLSELLGDIKSTLDKKYGKYTYRILAETTDVKVYYQRQYAFLTLLEKQEGEVIASAGAVIWRDQFSIIRNFEKATGQKFEQNLELLLEVEVQYHIRYGLRINILAIDESYSLGKLEQEKQLVLNRLCAEHPKWVWMRDSEYRSANHLKKLPLVVQKIALIAAAGSDGRRDFLHELEHNPYGINYSVMEFPAQVQGEAGISQVGLQLEKINRSNAAFDAVAIVRGGGGNADFAVFDAYRVALAVAYCPYPVFTGIGHERNVSITDLLAFSAEKTPTKCAAALTQHNMEFLAFVQNAAADIRKRSLGMVELYRQQSKNLMQGILKSAQWRITREKQDLHRFEEKLQMALPTGTLLRGFALVRKGGKHVALAKQLAEGDIIEIEFSDGKAEAQIQKTWQQKNQ